MAAKKKSSKASKASKAKGKTSAPRGMAAKMKKAATAWKRGSERAAGGEGAFDELDDGIYIMRLDKIEGPAPSESSGRLQWHETWIVAQGDCKGQYYHEYQGLEDETNCMFAFRKLEKLGYEPPDDINDLGAIFEELTENKPLAKIKLLTRGEFQNQRIQKLLEEDDLEDEEEEELDEEEGEEEEEAEDDDEEEDEEEDDDEEDEEEEEEFKAGDIVVVDDEEFEYVGETDDGDAIVKDDKGEEFEVKPEDLEFAMEEEEDEEEEDEEEEGEEEDDEEDEEEEESEDEDEDEEEDDDEEEEEAENEGDVAEGSRVGYTYRGKDHSGTVMKVDEDSGKLTIEDDDGGKERKVAGDKCWLLEEEEVEEEEPAPKKKSPKKKSSKKKTSRK